GVGARVGAGGAAWAMAAGPRGGRDAAVERGNLVGLEVRPPPQRMDAGVPERLVRINVPQPRDDALVEEQRLDRRSTAGERLLEPSPGEPWAERLRTEAVAEVAVHLPSLEQQPRPEPPDVGVDDPRAVVQRDDGSHVRGVVASEASRHPQVHEQDAAALEPEEQVFASAVDGGDALVLELRRDRLRVERPREPLIENLDTSEGPTPESGLELRANGLDLG